MRLTRLKATFCFSNVSCFLYGCKTWSLTLREECRLRVFENGALRRIFWAKGDDVTAEWRIHNKELYAF